ncbi:MAG TPA: anhydro-N-acetylmuramic acid kinase [Acidobacteriaceae bacterium]|nr:anhydro-N-acetylmuramic acid kinase [Acidobacteriaceae bacterium]
MRAPTMIVAGVMSGTSADGVDVALCRIGPGTDSPRVKLLGMKSFPYPKAVRAEVLALMAGQARSAAELGRLNWRLGGIFADAVADAADELGVKPALVGCHGQTIHHEAAATRFLGGTVRSTWQIGEAATIAERMRCPVVSDFRPADLAAGGQGAPLVPMLDWCLFRSAKVSRVLQNIGGIGNLTVIPAGASLDRLVAFDTGPGNMVIDQTMSTLFGRRFDRDGAVARRGRVLREVVARMLRERYFPAPPPKSCGREEFGAMFTERIIGACRKAGGTDADCVATATALTADSILDAYRRFVEPLLVAAAPQSRVEFCVAGGGAKNRTLLEMLDAGLRPMGVKLRLSDELGVPSQAKEAVAFALLAWLTWNRLPGNVPSATGANRRVVLGKVSYT